MLRQALFATASIVLLYLISGSNGGSPCPAREDIHPCHCTSIPMSKKDSFTVITCSHLPSTTAFSQIFITFRRMEIDRFIIIDSFLDVKKLYGEESEKHQTLPIDWVSSLKIRELEIIDSDLSKDFMCESTTKCKSNKHQTHVSIANSSATAKITTFCTPRDGKVFFWIGCFNRLKFFSFTRNKLEEFDKTFFAAVMSDLIELDLSSNSISKVGADALKNLPKLVRLNLSHNNIREISPSIFGGQENSVLKYLDLSWNQIITVPDNLITSSIEVVDFNNNQIRKLKQSAFSKVGKGIRVIDLTDNPVCCDCDFAFVNSSLPVHTAVPGICAEPERFQNSPFRQASRLLAVACNDKEKSKNISKCPSDEAFTSLRIDESRLQ